MVDQLSKRCTRAHHAPRPPAVQARPGMILSRISIFRMAPRDCLLVVAGALSVLVFYIPFVWKGSSEFIPDRYFLSVNSTRHDWEHESKTKILAHAPGWTIFRNLYMSNGTLYIVRNDPLNDEEGDFAAVDQWPLVRMMTSTGLPGYATGESIREREPTDKDMAFITQAEAVTRWGERVYTVSGTSWLYNDPPQFLSHYYHFVAELLLGTWAIYANTMGASITSKGMTIVAPPSRVMFIRCDSWEYRDSSNFNSFFTKAAFPSATLESKHDWSDRVFMTRNGDKVWRLETVLLADRSAAFRGQICGSQNQRIAAEAWEVVKDNAGKWWWEPIRRAALQFAGVSKDTIDIPLHPEHSVPHVITYISRQGGRRSLIPADHKELVAALDGLAKRRGWKFNHLRAQEIEKEQQLALIAGTTVLIGVHGNGLTHLVVQPPTSFSTLIEIFYPGGFAFDYGWTARTLGHNYFAVWNDTSTTWLDHPKVAYPEGFQGTHLIPVHGPYVAQLIEGWLDTTKATIKTHR